MAGNLVFDLIPPQVLLQYVRAFDNEVLRPEAKWTLDRWLPNVLTDDLDYRIRKGSGVDIDIAEYRAWDTPAPMTGRPGTTYIEGSLGPVSRQIPLGEEEYLRVQSLLRGSTDPIVQQIYQDSENMIRAVQGRVEVARGDILDDGKVTITENGLTLEANFGRQSIMRKTAAVLWTDTVASIPLTNLLAWQQDYSDTNGTLPGVLVMPNARVGSLALNAEMRAFAPTPSGTTPLRITRATINDILSTEGLPPIELSDEMVRKDGVRTRVLPLNKVYFMPPTDEPMGNTFYGQTAEALLLREKGLIDAEEAPGIVAVVTRTDHPVQTYTVGTGIALPATPNPDLVLDAVVAA